MTLNEIEAALEKALLEIGRNKETIQLLVGFYWAILLTPVGKLSLVTRKTWRPKLG